MWGDLMKLSGRVPLYLQVRNHMKSRIEMGEWTEGSLIPSELELCNYYNVSRVTMRTAIKALVEEKILTRKAGYGTTVALNKNSMSNFTLVQSFTNEMKEMGLPPKTMEAELRLIEADVILASIFKISPGDKLYNLRRVRGTVSPILYSDTYLLPVVEIPNDPEVLMGSLYHFLSKKHIFFSHFEELVTAVNAPKYIRNLLHIYDDHVPQLKRKRFAYDDRNRLIEYTETFYNAEQYEYRTKIFYRK
jgi:GntR family transcriptional regulator